MKLENHFIKMPNNTKMPKLIYGTAWKKEQTESLVVKAIKHGFRGIDTACQPKHYYEPGVGQALKVLQDEGISREDLFLQTKFTPFSGQDPNNIPYDPNMPLADQVKKSFETSQQNLGTDYVDSLVLHSPLNQFEETMQVWQAMEEICNESGAKILGISNCYSLNMLQELYQEAKIKPSVLQNRFYIETEYDKNIRKWCLESNITYQSFWTLTANPHILNHSEFQEICAILNKTPAQILFRYLTQVGVAPLTGTKSDIHMKEDLAIFDFELPDSLIENITKLL